MAQKVWEMLRPFHVVMEEIQGRSTFDLTAIVVCVSGLVWVVFIVGLAFRRWTAKRLSL